MSQQKKLEKVLDLLLSEDSEQAAEMLHQIIVEKARTIYESIVDEEENVDDAGGDEELDEADEFGGEANTDFTADIKSDTDDIESDHENDGEPEDDESEDEESEEEEEEHEEVEDRVDDLEAQLAELRSEFDALMGEEMQEPQHADLADKIGAEADAEEHDDGDADVEDADGEEYAFFEKKANVKTPVSKKEKMEKAPQAKDKKKDKKVDEETQFLKKVADTGQRGTAKLVGTGAKSVHGAENDESPYTHAPSRKDYGGKAVDFTKGTGGEYGKYTGEKAKAEDASDNVDVSAKSVSAKADATAKYTGGKVAGEGNTKSPLSKKP